MNEKDLILGILSQRTRVLEAFAHAYLAETGCRMASEVELVEQRGLDDSVVWYFRKRADDEPIELVPIGDSAFTEDTHTREARRNCQHEFSTQESGPVRCAKCGFVMI